MTARDDYTVSRDFPGWSDLTPQQKGHVVDIEQAAFWRGYNYALVRVEADETGSDDYVAAWARLRAIAGICKQATRERKQGIEPRGTHLLATIRAALEGP